MNNCVICSKNNAAYKCPKCKTKYCSIMCYKTHQDSGCEEVKQQEIEEKSCIYNHITEDTVPVEKLKLLETSTDLKNILANPHVRDILLEVDNSKDVTIIMDKAMKEPIFVEFADVCLKLVQDQNKLN